MCAVSHAPGPTLTHCTDGDVVTRPGVPSIQMNTLADSPLVSITKADSLGRKLEAHLEQRHT